MDRRLEQLLEALTGEDGVERKRARETLVLMGDSAAPSLRALLDDGDMRTLWEAAKALGGTIDPQSLPALIGLLGDSHSEVRWLAADGLINLGPRVVVPLLRSVSAAARQGHREMARRVLRELASHNDVLAEVVNPVINVLGNADFGVIEPRVQRALVELAGLTEDPLSVEHDEADSVG